MDWIKRFVLHFDKRHPRDLGTAGVEQFLTHLAVNGKVAASTQNQAKSALLFLYKEVLNTDLSWLDKAEKARAPKRLPVVLTRDEIQAVLTRLSGTHWLTASLLYGHAHHGGLAVASERCGFQAPLNFDSRRQRL